MNKNERYHLVIDAMRILAIIAVICIHSTTRILEATSLNIQQSYLAFILNQISRFAVPLFFLISGFVLEINYSFHQNYLSYLKKRLSKIFIPYLFWSAIYYYLIYPQHKITFIHALISGDASYQLYFIPALLVFYLIFPLIHRIYSLISKKIVFMFLLILQIFLLAEDYYLHRISLFYPLAITSFNYFIFIFGVVAAHHHDLIHRLVEKWKYLLGLLIITLGSFIFIEGRELYLNTHNYLYFYSSWRPSVLFYTIVIFVYLYVFLNNLTKYESKIQILSRLSFFVFFIHVIILELVWKGIGQEVFNVSSKWPGQQFWFVPIFTVTVGVLSFVIAYFTQKISFIKKISG